MSSAIPPLPLTFVELLLLCSDKSSLNVFSMVFDCVIVDVVEVVESSLPLKKLHTKPDCDTLAGKFTILLANR